MTSPLTYDALRGLYPPPQGLAVAKTRPKLDVHTRAFIARSPFLCIGTADASGKADVSPRGDPPGFVQVLDDSTLLIPDRPGNNRLDTIENIVNNPNVGLLFFIPGFDDTLRVNGMARIVDGEGLPPGAAINGRIPKSGIEIRVQEVFLHCAKALKRSRLWDPTQHADRKSMPSLGRMILEQTCALDVGPKAGEIEAIDAYIEEDYKRNLY